MLQKTTPCNEDQQNWTNAFFDKKNVISTLQTLLRNTARSADDLYNLCTIALNSDLVPALTTDGLMPFANNYAYIFPFTRMSKFQLGVLIHYFSESENNTRQLFFAQDQNFYYVKTETTPLRINEVDLLFGFVTIMQKTLVTSHITVQGHSYSCKLDQTDKNWFINTCLFKIANSTRLQNNTLALLGVTLRDYRQAQLLSD